MTDAPYITADGLLTVVEKLSDAAFKGSDTSKTANFPGGEPSVSFGIAHSADSRHRKGTRGPFLAYVRENAGIITERLEEARNLCREDSSDHRVEMAGLGADSSWPALEILVRPAA